MGSEPSSSECKAHCYHYRSEAEGEMCCMCDSPRPEVEEPPMTAEEEEQAPPDEPFVQTCIKPGCIYSVAEDCRHGCRAAADELSRLGQELEPPPPTPERRPPYAVAYSVLGHLYEVALSGDATAVASDGALIIQHSLGPVAGIVRVGPLISKEGADGADTEDEDPGAVRAE